jgi:RNA polymerase sigma-70 factor (ECF subfamily)
MPEFWRQAFEVHAPFVLGFLSRRLASHGDAEDLLQETFVRAIGASGAEAPREENALRRYLLTVARNLLFNRGRHLRVVRRVEVASADAGLGEDNAAPWADTAASPEERAAWSRFHQELETVVSDLPADHGLAFRLGVVERHTYAEIVQRTGWSLSKVKTNVFRARQRVIERLGDRIPVEGGRR